MSENYAAVNFLKIAAGRFFTERRSQHRRDVAVLGDTPGTRRCSRTSTRSARPSAWAPWQYEVVGVVGPRPSAGGLDSGQDDFIVIPYTTFQKQFGWQRSGRVNINGTMTDASAMQSAMIAVVPRRGRHPRRTR